MLETKAHGQSAFATLTYASDAAPRSVSGVASLNPTDAQNWLKRLRREIEPLRIRYFLVGEYGDVTQRPHYHAALFGFPSCEFGNTRKMERCCDACETVRRSWGHGHIFLGDLTLQSSAYIAGYVTKKLDSKNPALGERFPEFARMSLRPGIGAPALREVAKTVVRHELVDKLGDVPSQLTHGTKTFPLGRYLTRKLRSRCGLSESAPEVTVQKSQEELRPMWEAAQSLPRGIRAAAFKSMVLDAFDTKAGQLAARQSIKGKKHEAF